MISSLTRCYTWPWFHTSDKCILSQVSAKVHYFTQIPLSLSFNAPQFNENFYFCYNYEV
jgi:hypothetical protein